MSDPLDHQLPLHFLTSSLDFDRFCDERAATGRPCGQVSTDSGTLSSPPAAPPPSSSPPSMSPAIAVVARPAHHLHEAFRKSNLSVSSPLKPLLIATSSLSSLALFWLVLACMCIVLLRPKEVELNEYKDSDEDSEDSDDAEAADTCTRRLIRDSPPSSAPKISPTQGRQGRSKDKRVFPVVRSAFSGQRNSPLRREGSHHGSYPEGSSRPRRAQLVESP